jgi:hypothetical protein
LVLAASLAIVLLIWKGCAMSTTYADFDPQRWQAERGLSEEGDSKRNSMLEALERDHLRIGMSREAVRSLLGEPDTATRTADRYELGPSPVGVTLESYLIEYDSQGKVVSFGLRRR